MELKQVIVIRNDLALGKGKLAGQAAHASVSAYLKVAQKEKQIAMQWEEAGQKKVVLKVASEEELLSLYEKMKREMPCALIRDAGKTQIEPGTITCFGAGPADGQLIDKFTSDLKLL